MNKRTLIICLAAIVALLAIIGVSVALLYDKVEPEEESSALEVRGNEMLAAVPTDAVAVILPEDLETLMSLYAAKENVGWAPLASSAVPSFISFAESVDARIKSKSISLLADSPAVLSFHYTGDLVPLLVFDAGRSAEGLDREMSGLQGLADSLRLSMKWVGSDELSSVTTPLKGRSLVVVSTSDAIVKSALGHIQSNMSVVAAKGFNKAACRSEGKNRMFICNNHFGKIVSTVASRSCYGCSDFFKSLGVWTVFSLEENSASRMLLDGFVTTGSGAQDYFNAFEEYSPSISEVMTVLPPHTSYVASFTSADLKAYAEAYRKYADSRVGLSKFIARQKTLQAATGVAPEDWFRKLGVSEAAVAEFSLSGKSEQFILLRTNAEGERKMSDFKFGGFLSSLMGGMFDISDESKCIYVGRWLVIGSEAGIGAYADENFLKATLDQSSRVLAHSQELSQKGQMFLLWASVSDNDGLVARLFSKSFASAISMSSVGANEGQLIIVRQGKSGPRLRICAARTEASKEDDAAVPVYVSSSDGPFTVKNSGTGKMDTFSLQNGRLTLVEDGAVLWSVPFAGKLCGRANTLDFYANGRLQIAFVSGRRLYLVDRLGNTVDGFPLDLGKQVLLGPDVYDFNGARRYNIIVLNTDNTIDMYNLQGQKPASWAGITVKDKILDLPEYFTRGPKSYWAVHTAGETAVFPFLGGTPVRTLAGNVPASEIKLD